MKNPLYECACKVIEVDDGSIGLGIIIAPFDDEAQASECAEHIREGFQKLLSSFFEKEGLTIETIPSIIQGRTFS